MVIGYRANIFPYLVEKKLSASINFIFNYFVIKNKNCYRGHQVITTWTHHFSNAVYLELFHPRPQGLINALGTMLELLSISNTHLGPLLIFNLYFSLFISNLSCLFADRLRVHARRSLAVYQATPPPKEQIVHEENASDWK